MFSLFLIAILMCYLIRHTGAECSISNCKQCNGASQCEACNDGYFIQGGACHQCLSFCALCSNYSSCDSCKSTYWGLNQRCSYSCSADCINQTCDDITGDCYECKQGKYGRHCGQDCSLCRNEECHLRKCANGCKDGYFEYNTDSGDSRCVLCPEMCVTCLNETYCIQCRDGYYRHYDKQSSGSREIRCWQCVHSNVQCVSNIHCKDCQLSSTHGCDASLRCLYADSDTDVISSTPATTKLTTTTKQAKGTAMKQTTKSMTAVITETADEKATETSNTTKENDNFEVVNMSIMGAGAGGGALILLVIVAIAVVCIGKSRRMEKDMAAQVYVNINVRFENQAVDFPLDATPKEQIGNIAKDDVPGEDHPCGRTSSRHGRSDIDEPQMHSHGYTMFVLEKSAKESNHYDVIQNVDYETTASAPFPY